jgi:hypothetical protein
MLAALEGQINSVKTKAVRNGERKDRVQLLLDEKVAAADKEELGRPKRGASSLEAIMNVDEDEGDAMDLDQDGMATRRTAKRGGFGRLR